MPARSLRVRVAALAGLCSFWASPATAEVSLGLGEVLEAVKTEPQLVGQIEVELRKRDLKLPEISCVAAQHGEEWRLLSGGRAAPYACRIGERTLHIEADRTYFDANGHRLGQLGRAADNMLFNKARFFRERNFRWTWSP